MIIGNTRDDKEKTLKVLEKSANRKRNKCKKDKDFGAIRCRFRFI